MKVQVVEPLLIPLTHPELNSISIQTLKLERRLFELKDLAQEGTLSAAATSDVVTVVSDHAETFIAALTDPDAVAPDTATLESLDTVSALIDAHETLLAASSDATSALGAIEQSLETAHADTITELAEHEATTTLAVYLDASLDEIENELTTRDLSTTTINTLEAYIDTASSSLAEADLIEAHEAVSEARQIILADDYIEAQGSE
jgi:hypothetical protein